MRWRASGGDDAAAPRDAGSGMRRLILLVIATLGACVETQNGSIPANVPRAALVFSKTAGFRHASIPAGIAAVDSIGAARGFLVEATEDASVFTDVDLARFAVVIFLNTTGDVLDAAQQSALERFIRSGRGFVGVHSASDTEYDWGWYGGLVGAYFASHPAIQSATLEVVDGTHPSTEHLPASFTRTDEWYNFQAPPAASVQVLVRVDEASYTGGTMGASHPIAWAHNYDGGRAWYTSMGHTIESYGELSFVQHLAGGIRWAAGF